MVDSHSVVNGCDPPVTAYVMCVVSSSSTIMCFDARKPDFITCEQHMCRPACASAQSDQHLCCSHYGKYDIHLFYMYLQNLRILTIL